MKNSTHKHYACKTRSIARHFTNHLKELGYDTTQPKSKTAGFWLVSTQTKFNKPTPKKTFNVVNDFLQY